MAHGKKLGLSDPLPNQRALQCPPMHLKRDLDWHLLESGGGRSYNDIVILPYKVCGDDDLEHCLGFLGRI